MAGCVSAEVISFRRPDGPKYAAFVSPIVPDDEETDVNTYLEKQFSVYGLIYRIILRETTDKKGQTYQYAFVKFYSSDAAKRAIQDMDGKQTCNGHSIRAKPAFFGTKGCESMSLPPVLWYERCVEVANHYLGFNGWSSSILKMEEMTSETESRYRCTVQLHIKISDIQSVGVGYSPPIQTHYLAVSGKALSLGMAKKSAYQRACESAFSRLHLVCLSTGKVWCEVKQTDTDTGIPDIEENVVTVNQVDMRRDESDEELEDLIDGKELEELLNELQRER